MRILVLTNLYPPEYIGGYELICQTVVETLWQRGHFVPVLTSDYRSQGTASASTDPAVQRILRINGLYGQPWRGLRELRHIERHNNRALRSALQRHQPDLVYVWNMGGLSKSMLFTLQRLRVPTVYYLSDHWIARGLSSDVWLRWWNRSDAPWTHRLIRKLCEWSGLRAYWDARAPTEPIQKLRFSRIYFCSRALRGLTVAAGYDVSHGAVIYSPVHLRYFVAQPDLPRRRMERLLYVGRLSEDKGIMTALRALALLRGKFHGRLSLFGRGGVEYVAQLQSFARDQRLHVEFNSAGLEQMPQIYRDHDLLLFTSEWAEPFALTPIEAMACGLPVVGTTTGGSAELFRAGENGLTYTAGRAEELADRILQFASDYTLRARCTRTASLEARQRYAAPVIVDQIEAYLRETLRPLAPAPASMASLPIPCVS